MISHKAVNSVHRASEGKATGDGVLAGPVVPLSFNLRVDMMPHDPKRASVDKMKCIGDLLAIPRTGSNERQFGRILTSSHPRTEPTAHVSTNSYVHIFGHEFSVGLPPHHTTRLHHENGLLVGAKTEGKPPIIFNQTTSESSLGCVESICGLRLGPAPFP